MDYATVFKPGLIVIIMFIFRP